VKEKEQSAVIKTRSGRHVDLLFPEAMIGLIDIDDIGYALSKINRFNGHTTRPYSVAEHCLNGVVYSLPQHKLRFLMHDAAEAYLGDKVGPLKVSPLFAEYRALEKRWDGVIAERYGMGALEAPKEIHETDKRMLVTEQRDLMGRAPASSDAHLPFAGLISDVTPSTDWIAERFIATFYKLVKEMVGARR
jgi:hypothetical protein